MVFNAQTEMAGRHRELFILAEDKREQEGKNSREEWVSIIKEV
jgi:hypothetical protein